MTANLFSRFENLDPSLALALAALLRDESKDMTFAALADIYVDEHISLHRGESGDLSEKGSLSSIEVRQHLRDSVLPRLVTEDVLQPLPVNFNDDTPVKLTEQVRNAIAGEIETVRSTLISIALNNLRQIERLDAPEEEPVSSDSGSVLQATALTKTYRRRAVVDNVDLTLRQGEIVGLLGPNGAGKTTSFYMIVGLVRPDNGDITLDGESISDLPMYRRARRGIGYLAQEPSIFRKLTVEQNVMAILETLNLTARERHERLEHLLDELTIKHLRAIPAYKLSGGERRRLEITRALVTKPRFMLLDEPFAGVDPIAVHDIQTIVAGLRRRGIGVLITDHNVEQTLDIVDRAYIMFEGEVQVSGTVRELVYDDRVADLYLGPTLTARLRERLESAA